MGRHRLGLHPAERRTQGEEDPTVPGEGAVEREQTTSERAGKSSEPTTRPVSSAAQADFEGHERQADWDALTPAERVAKTEAAIVELQASIAETRDPTSREELEGEALKLLSYARADFFLSPESTSRYVELEASLGG